MHEVMRTEIGMLNGVLAKIKAICGMNMNEKAVPQDGRVKVSLDGRDYNLKVSILPTVFGEKLQSVLFIKRLPSFQKSSWEFVRRTS